MESKEYEKYRWFITSTEKLVIGGKNAEQNEQLLIKLKNQKEEKIMMHTTEPGSPFSVIFADPKSVKEQDIKECAVFTACFSRAWRVNKKNTTVDVFKLSQLYKIPTMKVGSWGVKEKIRKISVSLELALTKQNNKLRAVPPLSVESKKDVFIYLVPGKTDKNLILPKIQMMIKNSLNQEELISALPSGGIRIKK